MGFPDAELSIDKTKFILYNVITFTIELNRRNKKLPNIEIHGVSFKEAQTLKEKVFSLFKGFEFFYDMVVTFCPTEVVNYKGEKQPFLRLLNYHVEYNPIVVEKLKTLKIDIEVVKLEAFYPK